MLCTLVFVGGLSVALAAPSQSSKAFARFETHTAPPSLQRISNAPTDHKFTLTIALTQPRISELAEVAYAIADPSNARYGAHLTKEEADAYAQPDAASVEAVNGWLESHGLTGQWSETADWVSVGSVSVGQAQQMLDTTYGVFRHEDGEEVIRTESYKLPEYLHEHVDFVQVRAFASLAFARADIFGSRQPTTMFGRPRRQFSPPPQRQNAAVRSRPPSKPHAPC